MNKRTKILAVGSAVVLCSAIGDRMYSSGASAKFSSADSNTSTILSTVNSNRENKPVISTPDKGHISQSIDSLARQIIANAPNQEEAYTFLVEAKSYRIQALRARRAKGKAEESKANYDSALWQKKIGQLEADLAKNLEKEPIETQAGRHHAYQGNPSFNQSVESKTDAKKKITLDNFALRAIIKEGANYVARLSYGERTFPAKKGYKLIGKVDVKKVTSNEVVLAMGDNQVTLYTY